ncbi:protein FAM136A-like [Styela clava]|uniref:protein FAM136A-like n=1 Tax=Styela clava TaxID=7725 RepID=UPI001939E018|nr:protein FAM136A-like [Styela clava]
MDQKVQNKLSEIDKGASQMQRDIERDYVRKYQKKAYLCGANCCDNTSASAEEVQRCIETCQRPLAEMQNNVKQELERFQNRIQRCMMACQDVAQDQVSALGETAAKEKFESCLYKCAEEHLKLLPGIKKRLIDVLPK